MIGKKQNYSYNLRGRGGTAWEGALGNAVGSLQCSAFSKGFRLHKCLYLQKHNKFILKIYTFLLKTLSNKLNKFFTIKGKALSFYIPLPKINNSCCNIEIP